MHFLWGEVYFSEMIVVDTLELPKNNSTLIEQTAFYDQQEKEQRMGKNAIKFMLIGALWIFSAAAAQRQDINITASQPTHYFYTPMARVNPPYHLVASLHELSFSLPGNLQLQASLFDNIGRVDFGAKYGIQDNLSVGVGLAHSILHMSRNGVHGIGKDDNRLGAYLCYCFVKNPTFEAAVTPHTQLFGLSNSLGCDIGGMVTPNEFWSFIWEFGTSLDVQSGLFYFNTDGGLRVHPPSIPFLSFDGGIDVQEFAVNADHPGTTAAVYIDAIFAMVAK
jgi:hypothetical protein